VALGPLRAESAGETLFPLCHRVIISETDFRAAQAELAAGAKEVVFDAKREDGHYVLESPTAIK
jgi:hypothetical protein